MLSVPLGPSPTGVNWDWRPGNRWVVPAWVGWPPCRRTRAAAAGCSALASELGALSRRWLMAAGRLAPAPAGPRSSSKQARAACWGHWRRPSGRFSSFFFFFFLRAPQRGRGTGKGFPGGGGPKEGSPNFGDKSGQLVIGLPVPPAGAIQGVRQLISPARHCPRSRRPDELVAIPGGGCASRPPTGAGEFRSIGSQRLPGRGAAGSRAGSVARRRPSRSRFHSRLAVVAYQPQVATWHHSG